MTDTQQPFATLRDDRMTTAGKAHMASLEFEGVHEKDER
jgi:hypothetical protein